MVAIWRVFGLLSVPALIAVSSPATARPVATVRIVSCAAEECLLIRGHRGSPEAMVRINDRPTMTHGGKAWRVRLPVATIRDWSAPFARTLHIAVTDPAGEVERDQDIRLPVGLLGARIELASLIVRAR